MQDELDRWNQIESVVDELFDDEVGRISPSPGSEGSSDLQRRLAAVLDSPGESPIDAPLDSKLGNLVHVALQSRGRFGLETGDEVGPYRIEGVIGEGGMGTVFLASRVDGTFDQEVALKVLHRSPADEKAHQRFLQERQILAGLKHPNIARLQDGGVVHGMPYLVLERIDGPTLTEYCEGRRLGKEERIRLFLQVCDAIRYAHRQGVIHRDLKPSNLLVEEGPGGRARVAVLDFGIALLERAELPFTATGQVFGTPGYMSPEQALGKRAEVDRRSDVYALGVILYELLAGARPFEGEDVPSVLQKVLEGEPTPLRKHLPNISIDLATITETCLRRQPTKRYDSVRALAEDLESYLDGAAIVARPSGSMERWIRRARQRPKVAGLVVAAVSVTLLSLVLLLLFTWSYNRSLQEERNSAVAARKDAEGLLDFMLQDLHQGLHKVGRLDLLEQVAEKSVDYYRQGSLDPSDSDPGRRSLALANAGEVLESQGNLDQALEAYEINRRNFQSYVDTDPQPRWRLELARAHKTLAGAFEGKGDFQRVYDHAGQALELTRSLESMEAPPKGWELVHYQSLALLGWSARELGSPEEAIERLEEARAFAAAMAETAQEVSSWPLHHVVTFSYLGLVHQQEGDLEAAEASFRSARTRCQEWLRRDPENTVLREEFQLILSRLGGVLLDQEDPEQAARVLEEARAQGEILVSQEPEHVGWLRELSVAHSSLSTARRQAGDLPGGLSALEKSLEISRALYRRFPDNPSTANDLAWDLLDLGRLQRDLGSPSRAKAAWIEAVETLRDFPGESPDSRYSWGIEAEALLELGRKEEARPLVHKLREAGWLDPELQALAKEHGLE